MSPVLAAARRSWPDASALCDCRSDLSGDPTGPCCEAVASGRQPLMRRMHVAQDVACTRIPDGSWSASIDKVLQRGSVAALAECRRIAAFAGSAEAA